MRGNQEAYILVKIKDGRQYVCALNRPQGGGEDSNTLEKSSRAVDLSKDVIWN